MEQPAAEGGEPGNGDESEDGSGAPNRFLDSWAGVVVVFGVLTVVVAMFVVTGRRTTAEPVAVGPPLTTVEIGAPVDPSESGADLERCDDPGLASETPAGDKIVIGSSVPSSPSNRPAVSGCSLLIKYGVSDMTTTFDTQA